MTLALHHLEEVLSRTTARLAHGSNGATRRVLESCGVFACVLTACVLTGIQLDHRIRTEEA